MKISFLLHFYQPHNQQLDILDRIVHESYLPLTRGFLRNTRCKATVNISGALTELLVQNGYLEVISNLRQLHDRKQIEFMGSAKYHAFLPLLPEDEIKRQVTTNDETNRLYFDGNYISTGFFPPEMSVNDNVLKVAAELGYKWVAASELACPDDSFGRDVLYREVKTGIYALFRNKRVSSLVLSGVCHKVDDLIRETTDIHGDKYWFCVMDAETFGHHRIGHEKFLFEVMNHDFFVPILAGDILKEGYREQEGSIRPSTWTNEEQDFWLDRERTQYTEAKSFILWKDPENSIHSKQWELTNFVLGCVNNYQSKGEESYLKARDLLDKSLASDQYWWASAKPWWSLEMIEQGAYSLLKVIEILKPGSEDYVCADNLYRQILDLAFKWQRTGYIRKKHLENSSTYMKDSFKERTPSEWYNQMVLEFEDQMLTSSKDMDYEKAIKWRDALLKLKQGSDKYDVLHVVDELWSARSIPQVKPFLEHEWEDFSDFAKAEFVGVKSKKDFEEWKKDKKRDSGRG